MRKTTAAPAVRNHASRFRNIRKARTLSQVDLAKLLGVSQQTISKIEKGTIQPSADIQARAAAILGVGRDELFHGAQTEASA